MREDRPRAIYDESPKPEYYGPAFYIADLLPTPERELTRTQFLRAIERRYGFKPPLGVRLRRELRYHLLRLRVAWRRWTGWR